MNSPHTRTLVRRVSQSHQQLGAMILLDKPIVVFAPDGRPVPANLKRCAAAIVQGNMKDPDTQARLLEAIRTVTENDRRAECAV